MFLATFSQDQSKFVIHVQSHIRNQRHDLTETFVFCQREVKTHLSKPKKSVGNLDGSKHSSNNSNRKSRSQKGL